MSSTRLCIITCITNWRGRGPGHSAILIGNLVFSFEDISDCGSSNSGWLVMDPEKFADKNKHRPVVYQDIKEIVDRAKVRAWIIQSIASDDDYLGSGVCSSLASSAIEAGSNSSFNPKRIDTPYKVFHLAIKKGIVLTTSVVWTGRSSLSAEVRERTEGIIKEDYPSLVPLLDWPSRASITGMPEGHVVGEMSYPSYLAPRLKALLQPPISSTDTAAQAERLRLLTEAIEKASKKETDEVLKKVRTRLASDDLSTAFHDRLSTATRQRLLTKLEGKKELAF